MKEARTSKRRILMSHESGEEGERERRELKGEMTHGYWIRRNGEEEAE